MIVAKFGGTSLAGAEQMRRVRDIVQSDPRRMCIVVSAPGKRHPDDEKITDLLSRCLTDTAAQEKVLDRFRTIRDELALTYDIEAVWDAIVNHPRNGNSLKYMMSRGEYVCAQMMAKYLGFQFVDAADIIQVNHKGDYLLSSGSIIDALLNKKTVVPGFYGGCNGHIQLFSRGGSDITGAIIAGTLQADCYENWTDTPGILMADPRIVKDPRPIPALTYHELRELAYSGASVFHRDAVDHVGSRGISTHIRNTFDPNSPGTLIARETYSTPGKITGIAGRNDFTVVTIHMVGMNEEVGFFERVLHSFRQQSISVEHVPGGIDTLSVVVPTSEIDKRDLEHIRRGVNPFGRRDVTFTVQKMALISVVGLGIATTPGSAAKVFTALAAVGINVKLINQGALGTNIIIGVDSSAFEKAIRCIYEAFV